MSTTSTDSAAATALPAASPTYTDPGWYRAHLPSRGRVPNWHAVYIAPLPPADDSPFAASWLGIWLTANDARFPHLSVMRAARGVIEPLIIERIETGTAP